VQIASTEKAESIPRTSGHPTDEAVVNEAWKAADDEYENANRAWLEAGVALKAAEFRNKTKQIVEELQRKEKAEAARDAAQRRRDAIPKMRTNSISASYTYTEQMKDMSVIVQLRFQIQDGAGKTLLIGSPVSKAEQTQVRTLTGVQLGDTSVQLAAAGMNESQFVDEVEAEAQDALFQEVRQCLGNLPKAILVSADQLAGQGDTAGAAAWYMLYLDLAQPLPSPERNKAQRFLVDNFNFHDYGESPQA
jgi:hypothetical protein